MTLQATYENPPDRDKGATLLLIDDDAGVRASFRSFCVSLDPSLRVLEASTLEDALKVLSTTPVHVALLDKNLGPGEDSPNGIEAIPEM